MSATASTDAYGYRPRRERRWRDAHEDQARPSCRFDPWAAPKPLLIAAMVVGFIAFFPIGLFILGFMIGAGRIGRRWAQRAGMEPDMLTTRFCGWRPTRMGSGNAAFDEYRTETMRRLEEEQKEFSSFLERLRFAKDRAEFEQFMTERRQRPAGPDDEDAPQQG